MPILLRILAGVVLLLSVLFMPFWVSMILALSGMVYFSFFFEAVLLLLLSDLLFGSPLAKFSNIVVISSLFGLVCFVGLELLKKRLRLNRN